MLEKHAVRVGGAKNHRMALDDAVLLKENHLTLAGGIANAVKRIRAHVADSVFIQVEVTNLTELDEALQLNVDGVLLDNMEPELMKEAVHRVDGQMLVEASGGITLESAALIAQTGVDRISAGYLTHSSPILNMSLLMERMT